MEKDTESRLRFKGESGSRPNLANPNHHLRQDGQVEKETISRLNFRGESGKRSEKFSPNTTLVLEGDLLKDTETRLRYQVFEEVYYMHKTDII